MLVEIPNWSGSAKPFAVIGVSLAMNELYSVDRVVLGHEQVQEKEKMMLQPVVGFEPVEVARLRGSEVPRCRGVEVLFILGLGGSWSWAPFAILGIVSYITCLCLCLCLCRVLSIVFRGESLNLRGSQNRNRSDPKSDGIYLRIPQVLDRLEYLPVGTFVPPGTLPPGTENTWRIVPVLYLDLTRYHIGVLTWKVIPEILRQKYLYPPERNFVQA
jgi:hypothetical protein